MRKRIKNSLSIKVFLWVFAALTACSMIIYGIIVTVFPKQYQLTSDRQLEANTEILTSELQNVPYDDGIRKIYDFCIRNNSTAVLSDSNSTLSFGELKTEESTVATSNIATAVTFSDTETEYALIVSSITQTSDRIADLMLRFLPAVFVLIILLSVLSAMLCSKIIVAPIAKISRISRQMTSLNLSWKCDIDSSDEIGVLASSLNTMASRLQTTMNELETANQQLTADVKKLRSLEEQRRNFFAAASHELKTPLTIIKGQIENMILGYGDYQNHEKHLPVALKAAEDMEYLIKEIIAISKTESMDLQNTLQEVSLLTSVNHTIKNILPLAKEKDIQIHQNIKTDLMLSVNSRLWDKVLSNIIGNAIRHSPHGENVFLSLQTKDNATALMIENTGVFLPEDDLEHIFTPFYRADRSRSKTTGGSGLGLYIVKTILDLHGFTYRMKNTEKGTSFCLDLIK